jgi:hypothetical protein
MRATLLVLALSLAACTTAVNRPQPCSAIEHGPCGPERPANDLWQS